MAFTIVIQLKFKATYIVNFKVTINITINTKIALETSLMCAGLLCSEVNASLKKTVKFHLWLSQYLSSGLIIQYILEFYKGVTIKLHFFIQRVDFIVI